MDNENAANGAPAAPAKETERDNSVYIPEGGASRLRTGRVTSNKMQKTVVVAVDRLVRHRLYKKIMRRTSHFMAHDELGANPGDLVRIVETRPISKNKRWRVVEIIERVPQVTSLKEVKET